MNFPNLFLRLFTTTKQQTVITFSGGMGAQIISAAIYFFLLEGGHEVYADLSYFDQSERVAAAGNQGEVSHWSWQLTPFGLSPESFKVLPNYSRRDVELIEDGPVKSALAMTALRNAAVQRHFSIDGGISDVLPSGIASNYICVHVRRGDYVNVSSHLVADHEFFDIAAKFHGVMRNLVVVSDSPIDAQFRQAISAGYEQALFLDSIDAFTTHRVMRNARVLVCSNSQFSLIAALLNPSALVVLPKQWFGKNNEALEAPIHAACSFQLLDSTVL